MPAPDDDLPFVFDVEDAFRLTGRGTVIMGVIEQGAVYVGDHLELIQPPVQAQRRRYGSSAAESTPLG